MLRSLLLISLAATAVVSGAAQAQMLTQNIADQTRVSWRGVDFNKDADVRAFYAKLNKAAEKVCDVSGDSMEIRVDNRDCEDRALNEAVADMNQPQLSRLHAAMIRPSWQAAAKAVPAKVAMN